VQLLAHFADSSTACLKIAVGCRAGCSAKDQLELDRWRVLTGRPALGNLTDDINHEQQEFFNVPRGNLFLLES
jgi:hypothetical protein